MVPPEGDKACSSPNDSIGRGTTTVQSRVDGADGLSCAPCKPEPHVVSVRRALDRLPLSPAQRELGALRHRGESQAQIARAPDVGITMAADHVRKIYAKLDIHSVAQLRARIGEPAGR
jgi:DNA-binding CsgD family transcriptional regulator